VNNEEKRAMNCSLAMRVDSLTSREEKKDERRGRGELDNGNQEGGRGGERERQKEECIRLR
jgi:hypothetical protein